MSQITVAKSGSAVTCFRISIHAPGLGSQRMSAGKKLMARYGSANPRPSAVKTAKVTIAGCARAKPIATPMKGPTHGVATTVASTPVKKLPVKPCLRVSESPAPIMLRPSSNMPESDSAKKKSSSANTATKPGDCN